MILLLDALETDNHTNEWLVEQAFVVFQELEQHGVHRLAELAVQRLSDGLVKLAQMRADAKQQRQQLAATAAANNRRASDHASHHHHHHPPQLSLDTASMMDWAADTVMGNTGMFLLEDPGLQTYPSAQPFRPLSWAMAGSTTTTTTTTPATATPTAPSPAAAVPVSQVPAAPFPLMTSPPFLSPAHHPLPVTNSPFAVGLQPRLTGLQQHPPPGSAYAHGGGYGAVYHGLPSTPYAAESAPQGFAAETFAGQAMGPQAREYAPRRAQTSGSGPRHVGHARRVERTPRSQQRRR